MTLKEENKQLKEQVRLLQDELKLAKRTKVMAGLRSNFKVEAWPKQT
jgi:cell division protein FtsB